MQNGQERMARSSGLSGSVPARQQQQARRGIHSDTPVASWGNAGSPFAAHDGEAEQVTSPSQNQSDKGDARHAATANECRKRNGQWAPNAVAKRAATDVMGRSLAPKPASPSREQTPDTQRRDDAQARMTELSAQEQQLKSQQEDKGTAQLANKRSHATLVSILQGSVPLAQDCRGT